MIFNIFLFLFVLCFWFLKFNYLMQKLPKHNYVENSIYYEMVFNIIYKNRISVICYVSVCEIQLKKYILKI